MLIFFKSAMSQNGGKRFLITGAIIDEHNNAVPYAHAALYATSDSSLVAGAVSDEAGKFRIEVEPGKYYLKLSFLSYEDKVIRDITIANTDIHLGTVTMHTRQRMLEAVEVQGERSPMELQLDKRVFHIGKDLSNIGGSAADVLANLPSVSVDPDGTVSLRGSESVRILIDGRPSGLTSRDPDALRKLQGNLIDRIEVITNPSSRYDAAGEVGIINIILKKNQNKGINGAFTANAGHPDFLGASYSINFRRKNFNLFSSYGFDYRDRPGYGKSFQRYIGTDSSYAENNNRNNADRSHNFMAGLDYFINERNTLTGSFNINTGNGLNTSVTTYQDFKNDLPTETLVRTEREREDEENIEASLNYKRTFKKEGRTLTADFKWIRSVDDERTNYTQGSVNHFIPAPPKASILQRAENFANEINWQAQIDFVDPMGKGGKLETGLKTATRIIRNEFGLEEQSEDGTWIEYPAFSNNLIYTERIHAGYAMASNTFGQLSVQTGIRGEFSDITTELTETNEVNPRQYFNLFPSASLSYSLKKNKTLQLSYSYRINRPDFRQLLPFSNYRDVRVMFLGNPNLSPEFTHSLETGYLLDWEHGSILSSVYYRHTRNEIERVYSDVNPETGRTYIIPVNLATEDAVGLEFNLSLDLWKWWNINSSANFYRSVTQGTYEGNSLYGDTYSCRTRTVSKISFLKAWDFQTSFNYRSPRVNTQGKDKSVYSIDLGLSRNVFNGKGTVTANVRDLLNSRKRRSVVNTENFYSSNESQWQPRQLTLTFTYRLNRERSFQRERRTNNGGGFDNDDF